MNLINGLRAFARRSKKLLTKLRLKRNEANVTLMPPKKMGFVPL